MPGRKKQWVFAGAAAPKARRRSRPSLASLHNEIIASAFRKTTHKEEHQNKWISASEWASIVNKNEPMMPCTASETNLSKIVKNEPPFAGVMIDARFSVNSLGFYESTYKARGIKRVAYCSMTDKTQRPPSPKASEWWAECEKEGLEKSKAAAAKRLMMKALKNRTVAPMS
mmetsp:Transcript_5864/g.17019  ORF Transcript_5864/g.17019 Transcript_5864/m.17019 type:complete len:171 (-) Transcript_5864:277-789(-)|eukprot:CAMPEP_0176017748 /NCGR_PEP_ID=MMETSP0120_2-20121206/8520_1 /TAXON_ID=160619 /ORGANISM="Kryptoperidinium foliaceum, Strain CCMP 1326" /LENGTH=170 /DNA_ID=CAMNT_0017350773 /DNA_START=185 /DNA_END=697 /DNA_ORIENTATION=+